MNQRLRSELDYCAPLGIPHSEFLAWDIDDQDKALAYTSEMRKVCGSCGTREQEWADLDDPPYTWHTSRCPGCVVLEEGRKTVPDDAKNVRVGLITWEQAELIDAETEAKEGGA